MKIKTLKRSHKRNKPEAFYLNDLLFDLEGLFELLEVIQEKMVEGYYKMYKGIPLVGWGILDSSR